MKHEEGVGWIADPPKKGPGQNFRPPTAPTVVAAPQSSPRFELEPTTVPRHEPANEADAAPLEAAPVAVAPTVAPPPADDPYLGRVIDNRYTIEAAIAKGGMGVVYQGRHRVIGKKVAIKIIRTDLVNMPEAPRRFMIEAKAASAIGNEHIIDISDCGTLPDGAAYL
jgi:serine/threonine-protein kinase